MRFNLTTIACPAVAILIAAWTSSCLKGPGFLKQGETQALTSLIQTTEEAGDVTGSYSAASNRYQTILASSSSALSGASVIFPPGSLSISTSIILGEGSDAASADVLAQLGLDSSAVSGVGSSLYVSASDATDLVVPMSLSLPLFSSSSLFLDADTSRYAVAYVGIKLETKETSVGLIPNKEITFKDGNATFETSTWGSYRLVQISEEVEKPVERVVKPTAEAPPRRNNEVKDLPKMLVTGRKPFVVQPVGKFTVTGENLIGMRAFIKDRKLTLKESSDGKSVEIQLPTTEELIAITKTAATPGRGLGMFVIGLGQDGSPGTETNIMILDTKPTASAFAFAFNLNSEAICARQPFIDGAGGTNRGTGTVNCIGKPSAEPECTSAVTNGCLLPTGYVAAGWDRIAEGNIKNGVTIAGVAGKFPSAGYLLPVGTAKKLPEHPSLKGVTIPAFDPINTVSAKTVNLFDETGAAYAINLLKVSDTNELTPGAIPINLKRSNTTTLYLPFKVIGAPQLVPPSIKYGITIFSTQGSTLTRDSWSSTNSDNSTTWADAATGYDWTESSSGYCTAPATLPTPWDLKIALQTGITGGPQGLLKDSTSPVSVQTAENEIIKTFTIQPPIDGTLDNTNASSFRVLCVNKTSVGGP